MGLLVVGSLNMDVVIPLAQYPNAGETILAGPPQFIPGGKGANQAVAAGRMGADIQMVGKVGNDHYGNQLRESLSNAGVDITHIQATTSPTGMAFVHITNDGENRIIVCPGANSDLMPADIDRIDDILRSADAVLIQLEIPIETVMYIIEKAHSYKVPVFLDPAPAQMLDENVLSKVDWILPNEHEVETLTGQAITDVKTARIAAAKLLQQGVKHVVIKMGGAGALYASVNEFRHIPAFAVDAVDTTAAGDAFCAAFATELIQSQDIVHALYIASAAGAITTTKLGAQTSLPQQKEVDLFLKLQGKA